MRLLVAAGVLTGLLGCGSAQLTTGARPAVPTSPSPASTSSATLPLVPGAAIQTAEFTAAVTALRDDAQRQFPNLFGGVYWEADRVKLAFTRDAQALRVRVARNFPRPDLVDAVTVKFSFAELQGVADRITADADELARRGATLSTWGVNPTTNRVEIGIEQAAPDVIEEIHRRYGADILDIVDQPRPRTVPA